MNKTEMFLLDNWVEKKPNWCTLKNIRHIRLQKGQKTEYHYHDWDEYYILYRGSAEIILDNQRFPIRAGEIAAIKAGSGHCLQNISCCCCYVELQDQLRGCMRNTPYPETNIRPFIGYQGRYEDALVKVDEIPANRCAIINSRAWFWLGQHPEWSRFTSMGCIHYQNGDGEPDYHRHECYEFYICTEGEIDVYVGGEHYIMLPGTIIPIPIGLDHQVYASHGESTLVYFYGDLCGLRRYGHIESGKDEWVL
mgnify:CR=1 FL=1